MIAAQQPQPLINNKAAAWTIGVHALLLLLFWLIRYTISPAPIDTTIAGGGLEVNLGTSDNGSGSNQPMSRKDPSAYQAAVVYRSAAAKSNVPAHLVQSNNEDDPSVNNNNNNKKKGTATETEKGKAQAQPRYLYPGATGQGGNSAQQDKRGTSEGNTSGPGDRGVPGGTPGAANYTGIPGNGTGGIGHNLSGRRIMPDRFEAEFHEGGTVVIHVTVDKNGTIVSKFVKSSPSQQLSRIALDKLRDAHFSKSNSSEPQQFGDVTIVFKTRQ